MKIIFLLIEANFQSSVVTNAISSKRIPMFHLVLHLPGLCSGSVTEQSQENRVGVSRRPVVSYSLASKCCSINRNRCCIVLRWWETELWCVWGDVAVSRCSSATCSSTSVTPTDWLTCFSEWNMIHWVAQKNRSMRLISNQPVKWRKWQQISVLDKSKRKCSKRFATRNDDLKYKQCLWVCVLPMEVRDWWGFRGGLEIPTTTSLVSWRSDDLKGWAVICSGPGCHQPRLLYDFVIGCVLWQSCFVSRLSSSFSLCPFHTEPTLLSRLLLWCTNLRKEDR